VKLFKKKKKADNKLDNKFEIWSISEERWICIKKGQDSFYVPDDFVVLVKEYVLGLSSKVKEYSKATQYFVENDPLNLIFQWDDLFGITAIVPDEIDIKIAEKTIQGLCDKLNAKKF